MFATSRVVNVNPLRYHETINGRSYVIEVLPVGRDRWRAQIARTHGRTTAVMPFYGPTPDEAARLLAAWLMRAARLSGVAGANRPGGIVRT
jgi:hypothetical protein